MKVLLTGHRGYIGAVAGPILRDAGHEVVGLEADLYADWISASPVRTFPSSARIFAI